ncbi:hypothetical protein FH972_023908 [Carpinus fangiana]|uniref:THH1/TOM1/TOM3 domain-containing protein n=1 Tax=Carpinus fangiana TaxID=176857 RepID=A0A5N6KWI7_9ROSI|nr:hypothetical protein FH972_023908 [Carpinus fangiana]
MAQNPLYLYYKPSLAGSWIVTILYALSTVYAFWQCIRNKTPLLFFLLVGSGVETLAFMGRTYSITHEHDIWGFLIGSLFPVIAPSFIAASCYMVFGRIVWATTPLEKLKARHLWVPPRWITPIFCLFDLFSFVVQALGVAVVASAFNPSNPTIVDGHVIVDAEKTKAGTRLIEAGVIMQVVCFGLFALLAWRFMFISRQFRPNMRENWKRLSWAVNAAGTLIALRAVFRSFEYASPPDKGNYVVANEWCLYVLDCIPVLLTLLLFHVFHPGKHLPHQYIGFRLNKKMVMEEKRNNAVYEHGNSMYVDPERANINLVGTNHDAPPSYTVGGAWPQPPKNQVDESAVELGRIAR